MPRIVLTAGALVSAIVSRTYLPLHGTGRGWKGRAGSVAEITCASRALADLERIFEFLAVENPPVALATVQAIRTGIEVVAKPDGMD